jgi:outer membrane lipase/esterase
MKVELRRGAVAAVLAGVLGLLASCGGGSIVEEFDPRRVVAFGDELTAIEDDGRKYTINAVAEEDDEEEPPRPCRLNPNWAQYVADWYSLPFPECAEPGDETPSRNLAVAGASVADVVSQINDFIADDELTDEDLVVVLAGVNDVFEVFEQYLDGDLNESGAVDEVEERAEQLSDAVNDIAEDDGRVLISTLPQLHRTPYGRALTDDERDVIERMVNAFNTRLRTDILNDGHLIGVVRTDLEIARSIDSPSSRDISNTRDAACAVALPNCTSETLVEDADDEYMWADDRWWGRRVHRRVGELAVRRARDNPF